VFRMLRAVLLGSAISLVMLATADAVVQRQDGGSFTFTLIVAVGPIGAFIAGALATRQHGRRPETNFGVAALSLLGLAAAAWGLFYVLVQNPGLAALLGLFLLVPSLPCAILGVLLSSWSIGTYAGAAGIALDREDLVETPVAQSPSDRGGP
jgi:hypothetical protein